MYQGVSYVDQWATQVLTPLNLQPVHPGAESTVITRCAERWDTDLSWNLHGTCLWGWGWSEGMQRGAAGDETPMQLRQSEKRGIVWMGRLLRVTGPALTGRNPGLNQSALTFPWLQGLQVHTWGGGGHRQTWVWYLMEREPLTRSLRTCMRSTHAQSLACQTLWFHGLQSPRLLCSWNCPRKNPGVGCHFLLQGIFPTQGSNPGLLLHFLQCRQFPYCWATGEAHE